MLTFYARNQRPVPVLRLAPQIESLWIDSSADNVLCDILHWIVLVKIRGHTYSERLIDLRAGTSALHIGSVDFSNP
jgi:hypothetical protein